MNEDESGDPVDVQTLRLVVAALRSDVDALREALATADAYLSRQLPSVVMPSGVATASDRPSAETRATEDRIDPCMPGPDTGQGRGMP